MKGSRSRGAAWLFPPGTESNSYPSLPAPAPPGCGRRPLQSRQKRIVGGRNSLRYKLRGDSRSEGLGWTRVPTVEIASWCFPITPGHTEPLGVCGFSRGGPASGLLSARGRTQLRPQTWQQGCSCRIYRVQHLLLLDLPPGLTIIPLLDWLMENQHMLFRRLRGGVRREHTSHPQAQRSGWSVQGGAGGGHRSHGRGIFHPGPSKPLSCPSCPEDAPLPLRDLDGLSAFFQGQLALAGVAAPQVPPRGWPAPLRGHPAEQLLGADGRALLQEVCPLPPVPSCPLCP